MPTDYSDKKRLAANRVVFHPVAIENNNDIDENKESFQNSIAQKMQKIHGNFFDLTEEEIDQFQEELELQYFEDSDEDVRSNMELEDQETYADNADLHTNADDGAKTGDLSAFF